MTAITDIVINRLMTLARDYMSQRKGGYPIPIMKLDEQRVWVLDEEALEKVLQQDHIKDRSVVVVSIAGVFRKGKSFLLDFFLRYLNFMYNSNNETETSNWLGDNDRPLDGFSWRGGSERDTSGILMWSEVFCTTLPNGEEVAVILLDTQGTFDSESTVNECATIFALSTMLSSIQIYNLSQNIQEDDLQHLQLFTEYGRLALEDTGNKPFQKLQFLVRDWSYPYEASYGSEGGQEILNKRLRISDKQHPELQSLRKHIKSCFTDIQCFLMPHPGLKVATNPKFNGRLADIEGEFKACLEKLVPLLLSPQNLVQKEIGGQKVKVKELVQYLKCYMSVFEGDFLPEPTSVFNATVEANNLLAVAAAKDTYHCLMKEFCRKNDDLEKQHIHCKREALEKFQSFPKFGGDEYSVPYLMQLDEEMNSYYNELVCRNDTENTKAVLAKAASMVFGAIYDAKIPEFFALTMAIPLVIGVVLTAIFRWGK